MNTNRIFGDSAVVQWRTVPAGLEVGIYDDGIWATDTTPITSDRVVITVTSDGTGSTVLSKCEFDVTVRRAELCNGIDDDGDGRVDEDIGSCAERYLFVPLCWQGTDAAFAEQVDNSTMKFFYNRMRLESCGKSAPTSRRTFWHAGLAPSQHNWCPTSGVAGDTPNITEAMAQLRASGRADLRDYDTVTFLTDVPSTQQCVGGFTDTRGLVFSRSGVPGQFVIFAHEYGHIMRLSDEYFDPPTPEIKDPVTGRAYNRVTADLGCDPLTCCGNSHPCPSANGRLCLGNRAANPPTNWQWSDPVPTDLRNGRCIMSNASAPGTTTSDPTGISSERDWCPRCITRLKQVVPTCSRRYEGDKRRLELSGHVSSSGSIVLGYYNIAEGRVGLAQDEVSGDTEVVVTDPASDLSLDHFSVALAGDEPGGCPATAYFWRRKLVDPQIIFPLTLKLQKSGTVLSQVTAGGRAPNAVLAGVSQECSNAAGTAVSLDASGSFDPDGDTLFYKWSSSDSTLLPEGAAMVSGVFQLGKHVVTVVVSDGTGASSTANADVDVVDSTPPQFPALAPVSIVRCDSGESQIGLQVPTATDVCSSNNPVTGRVIASTNPIMAGIRPIVDGKVQLPIGRHTVEWTAKDEGGNTATATQVVEIIPAIAGLNGIRSASSVRLASANGLALIAALGSDGIWIEPDSKIGDAWSLASINLRDRVWVNSAYASGRIASGDRLVISGELRSGLPVWTIPRLTVSTMFPSTGLVSLRVDSGRTASLAKGNYNEVSVSSNATLVLDTGEYKIKSLSLDSGSKVVLPSTGRCRIMVENQATLRGTFSGQARLAVAYFGSAGLQVERPFRGQLFAPNASVSVKVSGAGAITAKWLNLEPGVVFECRADSLSLSDWTDK